MPAESPTPHSPNLSARSVSVFLRARSTRLGGASKHLKSSELKTREWEGNTCRLRQPPALNLLQQPPTHSPRPLHAVSTQAPADTSLFNRTQYLRDTIARCGASCGQRSRLNIGTVCLAITEHHHSSGSNNTGIYGCRD